ncbi:hypothetical protein [Thalassoroseus pseudoceratinae]|uniref:hypothetical protein n=1 Tax=Thalassoroseus pseudoceratinae TaxID=2713176 RepID=UPI001420196F|nr:hypothetical protein [Thalassoroseus pseudoceratinae]
MAATPPETVSRRILASVKAMPPSQQGTLVVVACLLVAGFGYLMFAGPTTSRIPLSWGKTFTTEELLNAERTLNDAGLSDFARDGQKLMVPKAEAERYNAALLEGGSLPQGWGSELATQFEKSNGVFESARTAEERSRIALANVLQRTIQAVPDIEHASCVWARSKPGRWPHNDTRVTATVSVRPRRGKQLTPQLVESLRLAVVGMIPDLEKANVTIFDQSTGTSHQPVPENSPFDSTIMRRIRDFSQEYQSRIQAALAYVPGAIVSVNVDINDIKSHIERSQKLNPKETVTSFSASRIRDEKFRQERVSGEPGVQNNQPRSLDLNSEPERSRAVAEEDTTTTTVPSFTVTNQEFFAAMPKAVQVSIKLPHDYYEAIAEKRGLIPGTTDEEKSQFDAALKVIETEELAKVQSTVAVLIPMGSPASAINVSSYYAIEPDIPDISPSLMTQATSFTEQWGSSIALAGFTLFVLWMLRKNFPKLPDEEIDLSRDLLDSGTQSETETAAPAPEPTKRETLQEMVRGNPEMAANIISDWLQEV